MSDYVPPFSLTEKMVNHISSISKSIGKITAGQVFEKNPFLRRSNRIRSVHSSLVIENNNLTLSEATDVINGKNVIGPLKDILEVKNAIQAYELIEHLNPYSVKDLLRVHKVMMKGLVETPGEFRTRAVGVFRGNVCIHQGTPAMYISGQIHDLLDWCKRSSVHPLIKSSVFHYEFEFIHPFEDGNGRMGRLWQTLLLSRWDSAFLWIPVESLILAKQEEYYTALNTCGESGNSNAFIEFMLKTIDEGLLEKENDILNDTLNDTVNDTVNIFHPNGKSPTPTLSKMEKEVLSCVRNNPSVTILDMTELIGCSRPTITRAISSLKKKGILMRDGSDKTGVWVIKSEQ